MGFLSGLFGGGPKKTANYDPALGGHIMGSDGQGGILGDARSQYGFGAPQYDPNYRITDFTGAEQAGQRSLINFANNQLPGMFNQGMGTLTDLLSGNTQSQQTLNQLMSGRGNQYLQQAGSGELSPHMQGVLEGQVNDMTRTYQNQTQGIMDQFNTNLGLADDASMLAGQFGGSRSGVAQGIVGRSATQQQGLADQALSQNMGQATSDVLNEQFSGARNAQLQVGQSLLDSQLNAAQMGGNQRLAALGMLPMMGEFGAMGGRLLSEVGGAQRALEQAQLQQGKEKWDFQQNAPWANMQRYADLVAQLGPYMGMGAPQGGKSPLAAGLGGAAAGFGGGGGVPGAVLGGVAGLIS